ncbi:hypothetical protein ACF3DV_28285 [Chlorogloeopsis fritschii PCC 9212]|uniref:Uncharacterized protein n=1 Tax=Chlorogloeopsis fritschii PCC 6912 TaxID=211165 RepID=A0A3S1FGB4_CHLFR|nr:hypothetical protein [Chlorogloeopsis fritschii]RUR77812.1 hypothetical protein PCC6912_36930 [Chlorogloeopsis fritschii PCC 6912]
MLETLIPLVVNKSLVIVVGFLLEKFWAWVLSDKNIKYASHYLKIQILVLYLDWVLRKTPLKSLPEKAEDHE